MLFSLTGGIGSGKSTVSKVFKEAGVAIVDADVIAQEVRQRPEVIHEVVRAFGTDVLTEHVLDRRKLGTLIFNNVKSRKKLEAIMLPLIRAAAQEEIFEYVKQGVDVCFDAPTLIESGDYERYRPIIVIDIPMALQLMNVTGRGHTMVEAFARIDAQLPLATKLQVADYVILNDKGVVELQQEARKTLAALRTKQ